MPIQNHHITPILLLLLTIHLAGAQPSPRGPNNPGGQSIGANFSPSMGVIIIVLIAALFFIGFFSIYIRHCSDDATRGTILGRRVAGSRRSRRAPHGLDSAVIESFPTFNYASVKSEKIGKGALECAVCLTEFEDDDVLRLIPKCDHVFHPDCIDAWLVGHTTCPVCRCNLADIIIVEEEAQENDGVVEVVDEEVREDDNPENEANDSMEQPLHGRIARSRTMRNLSFGRPRWLGKFTRSFSAGHVAGTQRENTERFTLRLPEEVRKQIMSCKLERTTSLLVLPRETSSRRGYRTGVGERSISRGRVSRSDRWVLTLAPPLLNRTASRGPAATTPRGGSSRGSVGENLTNSREGSLRGATQVELTNLPV